MDFTPGLRMRIRPLAAIRPYVLLISSLSILAILLKSVYRDYIYQSHRIDWGIADSSPNFFAGLITVILYFVFYSFESKNFRIWCLYTLIGLLAYEWMQNFGFGRNFDYKDIIASITGTAIGYGILSYKQNKVN